MTRQPEPGTWGWELRQARKEKRWRQADLGERLGGVTYFTVSAWELGDNDPSPENLQALTKLGGAFKDLAASRSTVSSSRRRPAVRCIR